jgi:CDP-6-deoxy-D-xylo-4-hexulose-3-dehydrase
LVRHIESRNIQTRMLFAGNIIRQPCFDDMRRGGKGYRVAGGLPITDFIMSRTFWVGVYPGLTESMLAFMVDTIREFTLKR